MKSFFYFITSFVFFFYSCTSSVAKINNRKYTIISSPYDSSARIIYGFDIFDNNDTLRLNVIYINNQIMIDNEQYNIVIDEKTKKKVIKVFNNELKLSNFDSKRKSMPSYSVLLSVTAAIDKSKAHNKPFSNAITVEFRDIEKNSDVSKEYEELIKYLKLRYKEFRKWPS